MIKGESVTKWPSPKKNKLKTWDWLTTRPYRNHSFIALTPSPNAFPFAAFNFNLYFLFFMDFHCSIFKTEQNLFDCAIYISFIRHCASLCFEWNKKSRNKKTINKNPKRNVRFRLFFFFSTIHVFFVKIGTYWIIGNI